MRQIIKPGKALITGTVYDAESLKLATRADISIVDLLELRVDAFADEPAQLLRVLPKLKVPAIVTVRDAAEGGAGGLNLRERMDLYELFLPHAALIDVELRNAKKMAATLARARALGAGLILSFHDFRTTPSVERLQDLRKRAEGEGGDVFKAATMTGSLGAVMRLGGLLNGKQGPACSVMGMGRFGKASRLLFAKAGSVLNYACLGDSQVSGQWPAALFRKRVAELE